MTLPLHPPKLLDKGKRIACELPNKLEGKKRFKCHCHGHFQADCPNRRALTIRELEELQAIEEATSEEEFKNKDHTLITLDVGELFVI